MKYHKITYPDVNNGIGCRVTLWVSGCSHHCKGCHNMETWDFNGGNDFSDDIKNELFEILSQPYIKGITLSGGDPLCSYDEVLELVKEIKDKFPSKDIWVYTGYTIEFIEKYMADILPLIDFLVDGKYIESMRDVSLPFRGSRNQRIWRKNEDGSFSTVMEVAQQ